jgi:CRP/FNR family transcriptional regulator, cyclic AMP receptor protein
LPVPQDPAPNLRDLRLFADLVPEQLREVARFSSTRRYRSGDFIFNMGDRADRLYFLERGIIKVTIVSPDGRERILDVVNAGEAFGELCLSGAKRRTAAARSLTATIVRAITFDAFTSLMQTFPNLSFNFVRYLTDLRRRTLGRLDAQIQMDRGLRLLAVLLDLGERCGRRTGDSYTLPEELTQGELARMVGLNRSTVSVLLNDYRRDELLGGKGGTIVIHSSPSRAALRKAGLLFS